LFFIFFSQYYKIGNKTETLVISSLLIANILYPNHQIITSVIVQNANHWATMPIFIYALSAGYMFSVLKENGWRLHSNKFALVMLIILLVVPSWRLATFLLPSALRNFSHGALEDLQYYAPIMSWINKNTPSNSVIFSNLEFMRLVPVYTHADVYYSEYAFNLPGSDKEIIERALLSNFFNPGFFAQENFGMQEDSRILWVQPAQSERNTHRVYNWFRIKWEPKYSLEKETQKVAEVYEELKAQGWGTDLLKKYQVDYIVWDKMLRPQWGLENYRELENVYQQDEVGVWEFNN
jgi:hypothetical protein